MALTRTTTTALTAVAVAAALAACSGATGPSGPTSTSTQATTLSTSTSTAASPTTTTDSPEAIATARAQEMVKAYFQVSDACMQDPQKATPTCFDLVAISTALVDLRNALGSAQAAHTKQIGSLQVESSEVAKVDLTNKPKETPPTIPTVTLSVCYDVSKVNVVDSQGNSIVPPDRKSRAIETVAVVNYNYPDPTGWRVGYVVPTAKKC